MESEKIYPKKYMTQSNQINEEWEKTLNGILNAWVNPDDRKMAYIRLHSFLIAREKQIKEELLEKLPKEREVTGEESIFEKYIISGFNECLDQMKSLIETL